MQKKSSNKKNKTMSVQPKKGGKPSAPAAVAAATITLTNPAPNTLEWALPDLPPEKILVFTYIIWGTFDGTVHTKNSGVQIYQIEKIPDITLWENNTGVGNQNIPAGTWSVRVVHFTANKVGENNWDSTTISSEIYSNWLEDVPFS